MKKTLTIALLAAIPLVAVGSGVAYAHWGKDRHVERAQKFIKWRVNDVLEEIEASERQTEEVNRVVDGLIRDAVPMIEEHRRARGEFKEMFFGGAEPDVVHAAIDERMAKFSELAHKAADAALEVRGTLTPEQLDELKELLPDRPPRH